MAKLTKKDMVALVAQVKGGTKKDAEASLESVWEAIGLALENGDEPHLAGYGNFEIRERDARVGRNPQSGEAINIEATRTVGFKVSPKLKDRVK